MYLTNTRDKRLIGNTNTEKIKIISQIIIIHYGSPNDIVDNIIL